MCGSKGQSGNIRLNWRRVTVPCVMAGEGQPPTTSLLAARKDAGGRARPDRDTGSCGPPPGNSIFLELALRFAVTGLAARMLCDTGRKNQPE